MILEAFLAACVGMVVLPLAVRLIQPVWRYFTHPEAIRWFIGRPGEQVEFELTRDDKRTVRNIAEALEIRSRSLSHDGPAH